MSIVAMADNKVLRDQKSDARADKAAPKGVPANIVNQLVLFIPTEIITLWVAFLSVIDPPKIAAGKKLCSGSYADYWIAFGIFALGAVVLTVGLTYRKAKDAGRPFKVPIFETLAALAAFAAWAVALPETPLASVCGYDESTGAFIVLVATILITTAGYVFGKTARFEKA